MHQLAINVKLLLFTCHIVSKKNEAVTGAAQLNKLQLQYQPVEVYNHKRLQFKGCVCVW